jgi:hypothetical protein
LYFAVFACCDVGKTEAKALREEFGLEGAAGGWTPIALPRSTPLLA